MIVLLHADAATKAQCSELAVKFLRDRFPAVEIFNDKDLLMAWFDEVPPEQPGKGSACNKFLSSLRQQMGKYSTEVVSTLATHAC